MNKVSSEAKNAAIIAYITIIGSLIAIFMNQEKKDPFARFHIRQAFGIHLLYWGISYFLGLFDNWMIHAAYWTFFFVLWLYGFIGALQLKKNIIPIAGPFFQKWFTFIQ